LRIDRYVDERRDPWKSTQAAIGYLTYLYKMYGDWKLAMASYNCGEACVGRAIRRAGTNDYWSLPIPRETKNYVPRIFAAAILGKNPRAHGFDVTPWDPVVIDTFTVQGGLTFAQIGEALGVPADSIAMLNPELVRGTTPPVKGNWVLHLPVGSRETFAAIEPTLERSYHAPQPQKFTYKVRRKQSIAGIAANFGVSAADVRRWNRISTRTKPSAPVVNW
jgi:membrane-bound lytic murein transglycosylase D